MKVGSLKKIVGETLPMHLLTAQPVAALSALGNQFRPREGFAQGQGCCRIKAEVSAEPAELAGYG